MFSPPQKGFTLIELLVVIGILAVLATTTALILNPAEFLAKSRDSVRVSDLTILNRALRLAELDGASSTALASRVYISLPDIATPADNCATNTGGNAYSLPPLPSGKIYWCVSAANFRSPLGGGWIPVNFTSIPQGSPLAKLPIDPVNSHVNGTYYTYTMGGSWKLTALMEANKHDQSINDGGIFPGVYEIGTNLTLTSPGRDQGLVGYWPMDEATGTTIYDASGKGNDGSLDGTPAWQLASDCKMGICLRFDSSGDYVVVPDHPTLDIEDKLTILMWFRPFALTPTGGSPHPIRKYLNTTDNNFQLYYCGSACGSDNRMRMYANRGGAWGTISTSSPELVIGSWHFIGVTYNNGGHLFWNGDPVGGKTGSGTLDTVDEPLRIGLDTTNADYSIDDVRIYNRALSASEIQAIYNATK